jgi:hypothetical protein
MKIDRSNIFFEIEFINDNIKRIQNKLYGNAKWYSKNLETREKIRKIHLRGLNELVEERDNLLKQLSEMKE